MASKPSKRRQHDGVAVWSLAARFSQHGCVLAERGFREELSCTRLTDCFARRPPRHRPLKCRTLPRWICHRSQRVTVHKTNRRMRRTHWLIFSQAPKLPDFKMPEAPKAPSFDLPKMPDVSPRASIKLSRRVSAPAESWPPRHRRDASSTAWRCGLLPLDSAATAAFSPRKDLVKNYRVPNSLIELCTGPTHY